MMKNKKKVFGLICLVLTLCITIGALPLFAAEEADAPAQEEKPATIEIVTVIKDVPQGTRLNDTHVKLVTVPNLNVPANAITDTADVFNKYSAVDLYQGEYIYKEQLSSKRVSKTNNDLLVQPIVETDDAYVVVTDYIKPNTGEDIAALVQELIDNNPKRTIYFPDGEYIIGNPIFTSDVPGKSTSIHLSDGAVIKASDKWKSKDGCNYMIAIGGNSTGTNDIITVGSYYSVIGGTLDGNGKADGISYTAGRESLIRDICIKNVDVGVYIPRGSNNGSSDVDFEDMVIYGTGKAGSKGFWIQGHDNTFTNIRIYDMETAIKCNAGTSLFKSIYTYVDPAKFENYENTKGFEVTSWGWFTDCLSENCAVAYDIKDNRCIFTDNAAKWTSPLCTTQKAIAFTKYMRVSGIIAEFLPVENPVEIAFITLPTKYACQGTVTTVGDDGKQTTNPCDYVLSSWTAPTDETVCSKCKGKGVDNFVKMEIEFPKMIEACVFDESLVTNKVYEEMLLTPVIPLVSKTED